MKKIICSLLLAASFLTAHAQNFEGIIKWSIKAEIDPAKKAEIQSKMKDAEPGKMDEAIKMMEQRMNDPQVSQNPQAKAQLEQQIQMMKGMNEAQANGGSGFDSMMPKGFTIKIKNGNTLTNMEGGMSSMIGDVLYLKDKNQSYSVKKSQKTFSPLPKTDDKKPDNTSYEVKKTEEFQKILNYNCRKYIVTSKDEKGRSVIQNIWATNEVKDIDYKSFANIGRGTKQSFFFKEIDGMPMKVENKSADANMTIEVIDFKKQPVSDSEFQIPSDFKETKFFGK